MNYKVNPKIFGFTNTFIYMFNYNKAYKMNRATGQVVKSIELNGNRTLFLLDKQNNIIQVDKLDKKLILMNSNFEIINETFYSDNLENVFLTKNKLAFVDIEKKYVIFV